MQNRVLVTGGAGYLGSLLCRKLLSLNYEVVCFDTCLYGYGSINDLISHPRFSLVVADIRDLYALSKSIRNCDAVIHLASIVGMPASNIDPKSALEINYIATKNIAELCKLREIDTLIFASTCSVYGSQPEIMITEKSKVAPLDHYARHKYESEKAIYQLYDAPTILRFGTLFGVSHRLRFDLVINKFMAQALNGDTIQIYGGGKQHKPFLHVLDAVDSICLALQKELEGTYNVISENLTLAAAGIKISKLANSDFKISEENEDNRDYKVSIGKIFEFGFEPKRNLEFAFREFSNLFDSTKIKWTDSDYSNHDSLLISKIANKAF